MTMSKFSSLEPKLHQEESNPGIKSTLYFLLAMLRLQHVTNSKHLANTEQTEQTLLDTWNKLGTLAAWVRIYIYIYICPRIYSKTITYGNPDSGDPNRKTNLAATNLPGVPLFVVDMAVLAGGWLQPSKSDTFSREQIVSHQSQMLHVYGIFTYKTGSFMG